MSLLVADAYPNFSICGLPYYLSGDVGDWRSLAHRTTTDLEQAGLRLLLDHSAQAIDPAAKQVTVHGRRQLGYDRLVIGTGAVAVRPPIDGLDLPGVHVLHTMADTFALHRALAAGAGSAVTVGGGYIGLEMAEAFCARGLTVTVVEQAPALMPTVDLELGRLLGEELRRHDVQVVNDVTVKAIHPDTGGLTVAGEPNFAATADLVLVVVGVRPETDLAVAAGAQTGVRGAIRVDRRMRTSLPDILAAGDCVETYHRLLDRPAYLPLGTTAHKQGRVAGETALGGTATFAGSLGTQVAKRIDIPATALFHHMPVEGLGELDLSYTHRSAAPGTPSRWPPRPGPARSAVVSHPGGQPQDPPMSRPTPQRRTDPQSKKESAMTEHPYDIEITRVFDAPPERVYQAFTDPDQFARWYGPVGFPVQRDTVEVDARVGGRQRFEMVGEADPSMRTGFDGRFDEVVQSELLSSRGAWDGIPGQAGAWPSHLRAEFHDDHGRTRLVVREGPHPPGSADLGRQAWEMMLAKLESLLSG